MLGERGRGLGARGLVDCFGLPYCGAVVDGWMMDDGWMGKARSIMVSTIGFNHSCSI